MTTMAGMFRPGGRPYRTVPDDIDRLPKGLQHAATVAWKAIMRRIARHALDETATDLELGEESGWSGSLIQKGLHALDRGMEAIGIQPWIERVRAHGRRSIIPAALAPRGTPLTPPPPGPPPAPPPEEEDRRDTTTDAPPGPSSSSSQSPPGPDRRTDRRADGPAGETASPELIARACGLVERATPGRVQAAVSVYGSDWVSRALDRVEERNRKPGNRRVESWGFVLTTLANWQKEGGPPPPPAPPPAPARPAPAVPEAQEGPPRPRTAAEVAELVAMCLGADPAIRRFSTALLRAGIESGEIPPELVPSIPPELLDPRKPRAP